MRPALYARETRLAWNPSVQVLYIPSMRPALYARETEVADARSQYSLRPPSMRPALYARETYVLVNALERARMDGFLQ